RKLLFGFPVEVDADRLAFVAEHRLALAHLDLVIEGVARRECDRLVAGEDRHLCVPAQFVRERFERFGGLVAREGLTRFGRVYHTPQRTFRFLNLSPARTATTSLAYST